MKWVPLLSFGLIGIGVLIGSAIWTIKNCLLYRSGLHAQGKVVDVVQSGSSAAEAGYLVVEFQTQNGQTIRFQGSGPERRLCAGVPGPDAGGKIRPDLCVHGASI